jgi:hypothetical protein
MDFPAGTSDRCRVVLHLSLGCFAPRRQVPGEQLVWLVPGVRVMALS